MSREQRSDSPNVILRQRLPVGSSDSHSIARSDVGRSSTPTLRHSARSRTEARTSTAPGTSSSSAAKYTPPDVTQTELSVRRQASRCEKRAGCLLGSVVEQCRSSGRVGDTTSRLRRWVGLSTCANVRRQATSRSGPVGVSRTPRSVSSGRTAAPRRAGRERRTRRRERARSRGVRRKELTGLAANPTSVAQAR